MSYNEQQGEFFSDSLVKEIKDKFYHVDIDPITNKKVSYVNNLLQHGEIAHIDILYV